MTCGDFGNELYRARQQGGQALKQLAEKHLPLVGAMLRRFPHTQEDREELYQQGCVGLMKALSAFDPARGTAFSSYAAAMILGEMRMLRRSGQPIRIPQREAALRRDIRRAQSTLAVRLHREPTVAELAKEMHMDAAEMMLHMEEITVSSTDALTAAGSPLSDLLPDPEDIERRAELRDILRRLPEMDQQLILLRYRVGLTQAEAGQRLGMTQMQVSRREGVIRTLLKRALAE